MYLFQASSMGERSCKYPMYWRTLHSEKKPINKLEIIIFLCSPVACQAGRLTVTVILTGPFFTTLFQIFKIPIYKCISFPFRNLYEKIIFIACICVGVSILTTASTKAETLITLMESGKELLNPFNTNAFLMTSAVDLQKSELKRENS